MIGEAVQGTTNQAIINSEKVRTIMSVVTLLFGQCGIQVGQDLFTTLYSDINNKSSPLHREYVAAATKRWFRVNRKGVWIPRSILIDTDNKTNPRQQKQFKYKNVLSKSLGGSGNNWAFGYGFRSMEFLSAFEEKLRKEFEYDSEVSNVLCVHSSGGGTGSGVGTRITEHIRDHFPEKTIINALILPHNIGEVVVHPYNTLLTISKLYDLTDSLLLFENEKLHASCKRSQYLSNIGYQDLNALISKQLSIAFQPVRDLQLRDLILLSPRKLVQLQSASIIKEDDNVRSWSVLMKDIVRANRCVSKCVTKNVADVLITRGSPKPSTAELQLIANKTMQHYHQNRPFRDESQSAVLLSNNNSVQYSLNSLVEDAWKLFTHGAYLHHYSRYNVDEQIFLTAFERLETILCDYKNL